MFFITSAVDLVRTPNGPLTVEVSHADGEKCPRCWRFVTGLVSSGAADGLCDRCATAVGGSLAAG
jgi:isoleucyl-tRNA synthetase